MTLDFRIAPKQSSTLLTGPAPKTWHTGALTGHLGNTSEGINVHIAGQEQAVTKVNLAKHTG